MSSKHSKNKSLLIADTGPLLALARINQLTLLNQLFSEVNVTQAVFDECQVKPQRLDLGELTTLTIALQRHAVALIDESRGRKVAQANSIQVIGSVGILILAKNRGLVQAVTPLMESLTTSGYRLSRTLIEKAKVLAGE